MQLTSLVTLLHLTLQLSKIGGFSTVHQYQNVKRNTRVIIHANTKNNNEDESSNLNNRRNFISESFTSAVGVAMGVSSSYVFLSPDTANALVKGNAPPPKKKSGDEQRKCTNVEECQEMAERLAAQLDEEMRQNSVPTKAAPKGTKYLEVVTVNDDNAAVVKVGDTANVHYKVLKLGKRSYDGLSGEGTVVFSRGYGLEDDESKPGQKSFLFKVGDSSVIAALNDALPGMKKGETRRISVLVSLCFS